MSNSVDFVERQMSNILSTVASLYGAEVTQLTLSSFYEVDRVELDFIASVYRC